MSDVLLDPRADAQPPTQQRAGRGVGKRVLPVLPTVPFFLYVGLFLLVPTVIVVVGAFRTADGSFTLSNLGSLFTAGGVGRLRSVDRTVRTHGRDRRGGGRRCWPTHW